MPILTEHSLSKMELYRMLQNLSANHNALEQDVVNLKKEVSELKKEVAKQKRKSFNYKRK